MVARADMRLPVRVVPLPGYRMDRIGRLQEWLVMSVENPSFNVIVTPDVVAGVLVQGAAGELLEEGFNHGYRRYWTVDSIDE